MIIISILTLIINLLHINLIESCDGAYRVYNVKEFKDLKPIPDINCLNTTLFHPEKNICSNSMEYFLSIEDIDGQRCVSERHRTGLLLKAWCNNPDLWETNTGHFRTTLFGLVVHPCYQSDTGNPAIKFRFEINDNSKIYMLPIGVEITNDREIFNFWNTQSSFKMYINSLHVWGWENSLSLPKKEMELNCITLANSTGFKIKTKNSIKRKISRVTNAEYCSNNKFSVSEEMDAWFASGKISGSGSFEKKTINYQSDVVEEEYLNEYELFLDNSTWQKCIQRESQIGLILNNITMYYGNTSTSYTLKSFINSVKIIEYDKY